MVQMSHDGRIVDGVKPFGDDSALNEVIQNGCLGIYSISTASIMYWF